LRLATSSSARFGGRQPYLFVRKIPYVIWALAAVLHMIARWQLWFLEE
jgi:hypothetical protein